jgi:23S rRNA (uridine2552-2'-O)-methyltransferase
MKIETKSKKVNKAWLHDHMNDPYVKMAQAEGYRARAAYKLKEIDEAHHLIRPGPGGGRPGSAPGAWSQYLRRRFAPKVAGRAARRPASSTARIIALDLLPMEPIEGVHFIQGDFREDAVLKQLERPLGGRPVDVVVSDMAPNLSGIASADAARWPTWSNWRSILPNATCARTACWWPRCSMAAATTSWSTASRPCSGWSSRSSPRPRATSSAETFLVGIGLKERVRPTTCASVRGKSPAFRQASGSP